MPCPRNVNLTIFSFCWTNSRVDVEEKKDKVGHIPNRTSHFHEAQVKSTPAIFPVPEKIPEIKWMKKEVFS